MFHNYIIVIWYIGKQKTGNIKHQMINLSIAMNYLKSWFALDCISAMPYDLILFGSGNIDVFIKKLIFV